VSTICAQILGFIVGFIRVRVRVWLGFMVRVRVRVGLGFRVRVRV